MHFFMKNNGFTMLKAVIPKLPEVLPFTFGEIIKDTVLGIVESTLAVQ